MAWNDWIGNQCFQSIHRRNLVYNTCWEDPRLDREALALDARSRVMVITSAGCNALDYALEGPIRVDAVDLNPLQNALLELKLACIRALDFDEFFQVFGQGSIPKWNSLYQSRIRHLLPPFAREIWDRRTDFFDADQSARSFYFRGSAGSFAWMINGYLDKYAKVRQSLWQMLDAASIDEQRRLFSGGKIAEQVWRPLLCWLMRRNLTMSMLGVPRPQRLQIDREYPGGLMQFIRDQIEYVFTRLSLSDNYFWRVYLTGAYSSNCCPEYLKPEPFSRLKAGLVDRVHTHTASVQQFLESSQEPVSHFVLLDHMDWLCEDQQGHLSREWQAIITRSAPRSKLLWRSAGLRADFVNTTRIELNGSNCQVGELLTYHRELASSLHLRDRVHTYGSTYVADLRLN